MLLSLSQYTTGGDTEGFKNTAEALEGGVIVNSKAWDEYTVATLIKLKDGDFAVVSVVPSTAGFRVRFERVPEKHLAKTLEAFKND